MPFEREVRAIELQQEAAVDDRLVFNAVRLAERLQIRLLTVVEFVLHRGGDDAGRGRGQERLDEGVWLGLEDGTEIGDLRFELAVIDIAHFADRLRRVHVRDRRARRQRFGHLFFEERVTLDIAARPALPAAAEPAHAVADIEEEGLALLLAIVADIDAGLSLLVDDLPRRLLAEPVELGRIDLTAARPLDIETRQLRWPRQAAGVGRQDSVLAPAHGRPPIPSERQQRARRSARAVRSRSGGRLPR